MVAYQEKGVPIDKLDAAAYPMAGLSPCMRERREGVKQNSAAHRVSIGPEKDQGR